MDELDQILKDVSRSFYLSMRILPARMREVISLAYLMARVTDTIADEGVMCAHNRLVLLDQLKTGEISKVQDRLAHELDKFSNKKEVRLLNSLTAVWKLKAELGSVEPLVEKVFNRIVEGQSNDVQRFEVDQLSITDEVELIDYCDQVAGCVGEFWTEVGFACTAPFSVKSCEELSSLGLNLGRGLQLVNIIRDTPKDLANGRIYLPNYTQYDKERLDVWILKAREFVYSGVEYYKSLKSRRQRLAVYLPTHLALQTLDALEQSSEKQWQEGVKVSRKVVYKTALKGMFC